MINFKNFYFVMFAILSVSCNHKDYSIIAIEWAKSLGYNNVTAICLYRSCTIRIQDNHEDKLITASCDSTSCVMAYGR
jgi:hypothetical protein